MKLVRTFHPVGHGAFYTERFYGGHYERECVFSVVYDCGCYSDSLIRTLVGNYISDSSNLHNKRIDVLFLSHLHRDHILGVPYLANICDKIYMPFLTPVQRVAEYVHNLIDDDDNIGLVANRIITDLYAGDLRRSGKIVEVHQTEGTDNIDAHVTGELHPVDIMSLSGELAVNTPLRNDYVPFWIHYPFHFSLPLSNEFEQYFIDAKVIEDGEVNFDALGKLCTDNIEDVARLYRDKIGDLNEYSMTVYSGFDRRHLDAKNCEYFDYEGRCRYCKRITNPNCFYSGDFIANDANVPKLINFYGDYFKKSPLIQIPHHGSDRVKGGNYDYGIFDYSKVAVMSLDFNKYPTSIPSKDLLLEILKKGICPKFVTQDRDSIFNATYEFRW